VNSKVYYGREIGVN